MWIPPLSEPLQAGAGFFVALIGFLAYGVRRLLGRQEADSEEEEMTPEEAEEDETR